MAVGDVLWLMLPSAVPAATTPCIEDFRRSSMARSGHADIPISIVLLLLHPLRNYYILLVLHPSPLIELI